MAFTELQQEVQKANHKQKTQNFSFDHHNVIQQFDSASAKAKFLHHREAQIGK